MRFKANLKNVRTFSKLVVALSSLEKIAWMRIDDDNVRFTVIPDTGSQVWALLPIEFIFDSVSLQSNEVNNTINLELPLVPLLNALRSALRATSASLRLTKKNGVPLLSLTVTTTTLPPAGGAAAAAFRGEGVAGSSGPAPRFNRHAGSSVFGGSGDPGADYADDYGDDDDGVYVVEPLETHLQREREKIITQDIPVRVLNPEHVETIMQPKVREPDVHIQLPPLLQLKAISDRFTKLAAAGVTGPGGGNSSGNSNHNNNAAGAGAGASGVAAPKLELAANMHGGLRLSLTTDTLDVASRWDGLENPDLDPEQLHCPLAEHPSTAFRAAGPDAWASVRVDGKDWSRVLSVGRLDGRVIACFADGHALILYVYVSPSDDGGGDDCVITYYVSSYSQ